MRRFIIVLCVVWILSFLIFLWQINRPIQVEECVYIPNDSVVMDIQQPSPIVMPIEVSGTDLVVEAVFCMNYGDGAALLVKNQGRYPVEKTHITVGLGGKVLRFTTNCIVPGEYGIAKERNGESYLNEPVYYCFGTQILDLRLNQ